MLGVMQQWRVQLQMKSAGFKYLSAEKPQNLCQSIPQVILYDKKLKNKSLKNWNQLYFYAWYGVVEQDVYSGVCV